MNGLANSIAQGQAQQDVETDCHRGPVSKVSGPPKTTASFARGGGGFTGTPPAMAAITKRDPVTANHRYLGLVL